MVGRCVFLVTPFCSPILFFLTAFQLHVLCDYNRYATFVCLRKLLASLANQPSYPEGEGDCCSEVLCVFLIRVTGSQSHIDNSVNWRKLYF